MLDWIKSNSKGFAIAVILHLVFLTALFFNWEMDKPKRIVLEQGDVIQVTSVDANSYDAEIKKIAEKKRSDERRQQQRKQAQIKKKQQEKKRQETKLKQQAEAKKKKQREAARLKEKKLKQQQLKKKQLKEQQRKEEIARKEAEVKKAAEAKKAVEAKKKAEQEKKDQQAKRKQQAEAEKKHQAEIKRQQQSDREEWLRKSKGIVNRHADLISRKIEQNWRQPLNVASDLGCRVNIKLQPSGKVISVRILESSGSLSFDRSVETAVRKASPLPVPEDREIFEEFRDLTLSFEPGTN